MKKRLNSMVHENYNISSMYSIPEIGYFGLAGPTTRGVFIFHPPFKFVILYL
jgi:hypothetical protein